MARGVQPQAKSASDRFRATNTTKLSNVGPRLRTMNQCAVVLSDLVGEAYGRAQIFERRLFTLLGPR